MKILLVNEFSQLGSGYGRYGKELLERFSRDGYEVAELACFGHHEDEKIKNCKWTVYPNLPRENEKEEYSKNAQNSNGKWKFEHVCLDFQPNCVISLTDPFFNEFIHHSPYREYFNFVTMAPVDGIPQHTEWINFFKQSDGLITYTDFGKEHLESYGLKVDGVASPASTDLYPIKKENINQFKHSCNLGDKIIIGTIMRNQPRKLFDALFEAFSILSKESDKYVLYCHTTYPEGWDIPELLIKHGIISKVFFTYQCLNCDECVLSNFIDIGTFCKKCHNLSLKMPGGQKFVDNSMLNRIINLFDCYVQLASREGFGMPQVEAASCNIPIVTIPYAGMEDVVEKLKALPINISSFYLNYQMNMMEAIPDINDIVAKIKLSLVSINNTRERYIEKYNSWENPYQVFKNIIDKLPIKQWSSKNINKLPEYKELNTDNDTYVKYLLTEVYNKPELVNSYLHSRTLRDLNFGTTFGGVAGNYLTEGIKQDKFIPFDRKVAYEFFSRQRKFNDFWQFQLNEKLKNEKSNKTKRLQW